MTTIDGAVVLVTGGQRGLGRALAQEFLDQGAAKVYVTARVPGAVEDERLVPLALEVGDRTSVGAVADRADDVTIVVNNAGKTIPGSLTEVDIAAAQGLFDINVFGPLRVTQAFAPILAKSSSTAVVNIHSALSWAAGAGAYGASKAALWSITNSLRGELAGQGTQVVGVHLGYTDTDMIRGLDVEKNDPRDVARQVVDAVREGRTEVLADDVSRHFKAALSGPVEGLALPTA